jgi:hypothetical protein
VRVSQRCYGIEVVPYGRYDMLYQLLSACIATLLRNRSSSVR